MLYVSEKQLASDKKSYDENDKPLKHNALSEMMYHCEQCLSPDYGQWMLLRLTDIIHTEGDNIFTHCLGRLIANRRIEADSSVRFAPIWLDDALRVSATLVRQLLSGAENWGVFHYGSADPCSEREFAQQIVESITALKKDWTAQLVSVPSDKQGKVSTVLKCRRVRNNFGVHGRTWRQGLKARIQFWLDCYGSEYKQLNAAASESVSLPNAG